jgi:uncharacterized protein (DUF1697 family)
MQACSGKNSLPAQDALYLKAERNHNPRPITLDSERSLTLSMRIQTYVSLLRGINVSGHKIIKMEQLRKSFEALSLGDVQTYVQSGNVVFRAPKQSSETLSNKIREKIARDFGFSVPVIIRSSEEVRRAIEDNPFLKQRGIDSSKLHVTFLSKAPEKDRLKALEALTAKPDQFRYSGTEVYLYCPDGYGRTKLSNNALERVLGVTATTRNWNTVNTLYEMSLK